jgi:hypothetical protein
MTQDQIKSGVFALLAGLVLIGFMWLFGTELAVAFWPEKKHVADAAAAAAAAATEAKQDIDDPWTYVATALAALVGGVAAVFLGVQGERANVAFAGWNASDWIRLAYVIIYIVYGSVAIAVWVTTGTDTSLLLKNLAVTFLGLVGPAVGGYLGAKPTE